MQVTAFVGMIVVAQLFDSLSYAFRIDGLVVVLQIELDFFDGFGEHELMLGRNYFFSLFKLFKLLVNINDFFEIQFLKIYVHPPHQKIDEVSLLQFVVT